MTNSLIHPLQDPAQPARSHQRWTRDDDKLLTRAVQREHSVYAMSLKLARSPVAVHSRITKRWPGDATVTAMYGTYDKPGPLATYQDVDNLYWGLLPPDWSR